MVLPLISTLLALFYDFDHSGDEEPAPPQERKRVAPEPTKARVQDESIDEDILAEIEDDLARHAEREQD